MTAATFGMIKARRKETMNASSNANLYDVMRDLVFNATDRANRDIERLLNEPLEGNPKLIYADPPKLCYYTPPNIIEYIEGLNGQRKKMEGKENKNGLR